jgi:hypothetical protein
VLLASHIQIVNLGVEGIPHLPRGAAEDDQHLTGRNRVDFEAMAFEPRADHGDVRVGDSVAATDVLRAKPLVVNGRAAVVHLVDAGGQRCLLLGAAPEHQDDVLERQAVVDPALIILGPRQGVEVALQAHERVIVHAVDDARERQGRALGIRRGCGEPWQSEKNRGAQASKNSDNQAKTSHATIPHQNRFESAQDAFAPPGRPARLDIEHVARCSKRRECNLPAITCQVISRL